MLFSSLSPPGEQLQNVWKSDGIGIGGIWRTQFCFVHYRTHDPDLVEKSSHPNVLSRTCIHFQLCFLTRIDLRCVWSYFWRLNKINYEFVFLSFQYIPYCTIPYALPYDKAIILQTSIKIKSAEIKEHLKQTYMFKWELTLI